MTKKKFSFIRIIAVTYFIVCILTLVSIKEVTNCAFAYEPSEKYYGSIAYSETTIGKSETERIEYATKNIRKYDRVNVTFPDCYNTDNNLENACANVAGANIINYYDRFYDDFIPDYTSGRIVKNQYVYYPMRMNQSKKQAVINTLYSYMRTGLDYNGTTQAMFKQGLTQYINEKGKSITYNNVFSNKKFDIDKFITQIQMGHPVVLYLSGFNLTSVNYHENVDILNKSIYDNDTHIAIAYGYQIVDYYNNDGAIINSKVYIEVASGIRMVVSTGVVFYYLLDNNGVMDDAEAVNVY